MHERLRLTGNAWKFYDDHVLPHIDQFRGTTRLAEAGQEIVLKQRFPDSTTDANGETITVEDRGDFKHFLMETKAVQRFLRGLEDSEVVADLGSYHGFYSLLAGTTAKSYVFEIDYRNLTRLEKNLELNPDLDIEVVPQAVWNENTQLDIDAGQEEESNVTALETMYRPPHSTFLPRPANTGLGED